MKKRQICPHCYHNMRMDDHTVDIHLNAYQVANLLWLFRKDNHLSDTGDWYEEIKWILKNAGRTIREYQAMPSSNTGIPAGVLLDNNW